MTTPGGPNIKLFPLASQSTLQYWWKPPTEGGADVTEYELTVTPGPYTFRLPGGATYCTVEGLSDGAFYSASIRATCNYPDWGPSSVFYEWQPGLPPSSQPQTPIATRLGWTTGIVTWDSSPLLSDSSIRWLVITSKSSDQTDIELKYTVSAQRDTSCYIEGMNPYSRYYFTIEAVNYIGYGVPVSTNTVEGVFLPSYVPGIQVWLDSQDYKSFTFINNVNVSQWNDKSGNGRHAIPGGAGYPIYSSTSLDSYPSVYFDSSKWLKTAEPAGTYSSQVNGFMIYKTTHNSAYGGMLSRTVLNTFYRAAPFKVQGTERRRGDGTNETLFATYNNYPANPTIYNFNASASFWKDWVNTSISTDNATAATYYNDTAAYTHHGYEETSGTKFNGNISETVLYNTTIPHFIRQKLEGYFAWRWGLVSKLPISHPFYSRPPWGDTTFNPLFVSGLNLWYDGADPLGTGNAPVQGTSIQTWVDKSGLANHAVAGAAATYIAATSDSPGYLSFNGTSTYYNITNTSFINNQQFMIFIVDKLATYSTGTPYILNGSGGASASIILKYTGTTQLVLDYNYTGTSITTNVTGYGTNSPHPTRVWSIVQTTTGRQIHLNGNLPVSDGWNTLVSSWQGAQIGGQGTGIYYGGGIKEIIIITGIPTTENRQVIEGYLAWKWGTEGLLPSSHPYKSIDLGKLISPFLPNLISGNSSWFDAADNNAFYLNNTNKVITWLNKAIGPLATNHFSQGTDALRPLRVAYGSSYAVEFSGSTYLIGPTSQEYTSTTARTIFIVGLAAPIATNDATNPWNNDALIGASRADKYYMYFRSNGTFNISNYTGSTGGQIIVSLPYTIGELELFQYEFSTGSLKARLTGGTAGSIASDNTFSTGFTTGSTYLGSSYNLTYFFKGKMMEVLTYNRLVTDTERQKIEGYLAWKWGLVNKLPANHPYKTSQPTI